MMFAPEINKHLRLQNYREKTTIEGVQVIPIRRYNDDGGSFLELTRLVKGVSTAVKGLPIAQINYSQMEPSALKAFHVHKKQTDVWFVPSDGKILLVLVDLRISSPSHGALMRLILGDDNSQLIVIPPGVAHGCKNISLERASIIYFMDKNFSLDSKKCDEWRLPWDYFGSDLWEIQKG